MISLSSFSTTLHFLQILCVKNLCVVDLIERQFALHYTYSTIVLESLSQPDKKDDHFTL